MKIQKQLEKVVSFILTIVVIIGAGQGSLAASSFSDTKNHWAETDIQKSIIKGFVKGYNDGTFKPNQPVTRAEFSKMLNVALGVTMTGGIALNDVDSGDWYYDDVRKAVTAGYITGYTDSTFRPNNKITRQEAASMISKILPNYGATVSLYGLKDYGSIASWAKDGVMAVYARGYMKGDSQNMYRPTGNLTRGEACAILVRLVEGESIVSSSYVLDDDGDSISNKIFTNNVIVDEDVDDGEVTLDKVIILGTLTIEGGGENTVEISDSVIKNMSVAKSSGDVRVLLTGNSVVKDATLKYGAIIEQKSLSGDGFQKLRLNGSTLENQEVTLKGNFSNVILEDEAVLKLSTGKITTLTVNAGAATSAVELSSGTIVNTAVVNGKTEFIGTGKITEMKANANDITYETKPSTIDKGSGITRPPVLEKSSDGPEPTFTPKDGATSISPDTKITIKFDEAIYIAGGKKVTTSDIEDIVEIRKSTATGSKIDFTGTISTDKKTLTLTPTEVLSKSTNYYVIVLDGEIEDAEENENEKFTANFKTGTQDSAAPKPTFSPANGATNVAVGTKIKITFDEAILLAGDKTVTNSSISNIIELREGSSTGTKKPFSATINSAKKIIEITPSAELTIGKEYFIIILSGKIEDDEGNENSKITSMFSTSTPLASTPTITTLPGNVTAVENDGSVLVTLSPGASGGNVYYTLNGSTPTVSSTPYTEAFNITKNVSNNVTTGQAITITIKAVTIKSGYTNSAVASKTITFKSDQVGALIITTNPLSDSASPRNDAEELVFISSTSDTTRYNLYCNLIKIWL